MVGWHTRQIYDVERMDKDFKELGYWLATMGKDEVRYRRGDFHLIVRRKTTHINFSLHLDQNGQDIIASGDAVEKEYRKLNRLLQRLVRL